MSSSTSKPNSTWKPLPRSSNQAIALGRLYFFTGERCRNGHIALSKVHHGCVVCMGLSKARAEIRLHERIALRELDREGKVKRPNPVSKDTAEGRVLIATAERGGVILQTELVDPSTRGMGKAIVSRAFQSLLRRKMIKHKGGVYSVTMAGYGAAARLGAVNRKWT